MSDEQIQIQRLSDLDEWELYEIARAGAPAITVGLRPYTEFQQVEYEVWNEDGEELALTGSVPCDDVGERWADAERELIMAAIFEQIRGEG